MTPNPAPLCHVDDVNNGAKGFTYKGSALFVIQQEEAFYAYSNACPHLGLPLEWQADQFLTKDQSLIQCATHGALFEIDTGACIYGPCQGQHLKAITIYIENNYIYVRD